MPDEDTHPHPAVSRPGQERKQDQLMQPAQMPDQNNAYANFTHREHGTGALSAYPAAAPQFRPAYPPSPFAPPQPGAGAQNNQYAPSMPRPPMQPQGIPPSMPYPAQSGQQGPYPAPAYANYAGYGYPGYPGYAGYPGYPGYPMQPYGYAPYPAHPGYAGYPGYPGYPVYLPQKPKRDGYLFGMNIVTVVGASIVLLAGLGILLITLIIAFSPNSQTTGPDKYFDLILQLAAFTGAGIIGGAFALYHSIRAFMRRPSADLRLPMFWIFLILYGIVIAIGFGLQNSGNAVTNFAISAFLIALAAIFPALALLALGVRRLHFSSWPRWSRRRQSERQSNATSSVARENAVATPWTTTWRRFAVALTSGATTGIGLALALELLFGYLLVRGLQTSALNCINDPSAPGCGTFSSFNITFLFVAIIGPVVEETVKPLAVVIFIGRVRSGSEAFVLGMACGIGFALIETVGYIGLGYQDWLSVALIRTGASLLHGFGAGMVALGWYYLFHAKKYRFLKFIGCYGYAVFQHFVWNATALLSLLPGPIGSTINSWNLNLGFIVLPFVELLNIIEIILILVFFIYITGRIRKRPARPPETRSPEPAGNVPAYART